MRYRLSVLLVLARLIFYLPVIKWISHSIQVGWRILSIVPPFDIHIRSSNLLMYYITILLRRCHSCCLLNTTLTDDQHQADTSPKPFIELWILCSIILLFLRPINFVTISEMLHNHTYIYIGSRNNTFYDQLDVKWRIKKRKQINIRVFSDSYGIYV